MSDNPSDKKPKNATEAARQASDDVAHSMFMAEMEGRSPRGYDVRLMRERERREAEMARQTKRSKESD